MTTPPNPNKKVCGAKLRNKNATCKRWAMANGRCKFHGGATPKGIASPHWKGKNTGKYSQYLPEDAQKIYDVLAEGGEWASLRGEIDLLQSRVMMLLGSLPEGQPPLEQWRKANRLFGEWQVAAQAKNAQGASEAVVALIQTLTEGLDQAGVWNEVYDVVERLRKLVESERKRSLELQNVLTPEQGAIIFGAMGEMARLVCPENKAAAAAILYRIFPPLPVTAARPALGSESRDPDRIQSV
jgi:hypothetical protein